MEWLKTSLLVFILFIFAVNNVKSEEVDLEELDRALIYAAKSLDFMDPNPELMEILDDESMTPRERMEEYNKRKKELEKEKEATREKQRIREEAERSRQSNIRNAQVWERRITKPKTTTEEITETAVKDENVHKSNSDYSDRNSIELARNSKESTTAKSNTDEENSTAMITLYISGIIFILVCLAVVLFSAFMYGRRMKLYEEMNRKQSGQLQVGYNFHQTNNMMPARTATATPSAATSRTSNEAVANTKTNVSASKE